MSKNNTHEYENCPCGGRRIKGQSAASETVPMREALEHIARLPESYPASAIIARAKDALKKADPQVLREAHPPCTGATEPAASAPCVADPIPEDTMDRLLVGKATQGDQMLAYNALRSHERPGDK